MGNKGDLMESATSTGQWLQAQQETLAKHSGWFKALAVAWIVLGFLAIVVPLAAGLAIELLLGWLFIFGGVIQLAHVFRVRAWSGVALGLLSGILYLGSGLVLVLFPLQGVAVLTLFLAALFIADGVLSVVLSIRMRPHRAWGAILLSGILGLVVGGLIWWEFPSSAAWAIGTLAGINLIFGGFAFWRLASSSTAGPGASAAPPLEA